MDNPRIVFRSNVQAEAEMVLELLRAEAIDARLILPSGALAGAALNLYQTRVEVPFESAARAAELLKDFELLGSSEAMDRGAEGEAPMGPRPRLKLIAAGIGLVCPGGSHLYARRPWTALVMASGFAAALVMRGIAARTLAPWLEQFSFIALATTVAADIAGGLRALGATNRDERSARRAQLARGAAWLGGALALAGGVTTIVDAPRRAGARALARVTLSCSDGELRFDNGSDEGQVIIIDTALLLPLPVPHDGYEPYAAAVARRVDLGPHASATTPIRLFVPARDLCAQAAAAPGSVVPPPSLSRTFAPAGTPLLGCAIWLHLTLEPASGSDAARIAATGACQPPWGQPGASGPQPLLPAH